MRLVASGSGGPTIQNLFDQGLLAIPQSNPNLSGLVLTKQAIANNPVVQRMIATSLAQNPDASTGGGSYPGGVGGATTPPPGSDNTQTGRASDIDWATAWFGTLGLPSDIAAEVNKIISKYSNDSDALAAATAYIRGTPWYAQTFPGITEAMSKGLVSNEAGYRALLNQQTQIYKQYLGRDITSDEFANNLRAGLNNQTIANQFQGNALAATYGTDWRYALGNFGEGQPSQADLNALGQEQAGLDTPLGQAMKRRLDLAQQRLSGIFQGGLANPNLSLSTGRLGAPSLNAASANPDVAA